VWRFIIGTFVSEGVWFVFFNGGLLDVSTANCVLYVKTVEMSLI